MPCTEVEVPNGTKFVATILKVCSKVERGNPNTQRARQKNKPNFPLKIIFSLKHL
jgi:hypothetical protein